MMRDGCHDDAHSTTRAIALAALVLAASGCASGQRAERERELATLRAALDELKRAQDANTRELQRLAGDVKTLDAQATFLVSETKTVSAESRRLASAVDEHERAIASLRTSVDELRKPEPAPAAPAKPAPQSSAPDASPEQLFASAMASLQADEYGQAVLEWSELTRRFPEHALASSAQYWIGEAYYRQRDFPQAVLEFRKVIDAYPKSPQTPEALLKIGLCQRALRDVAHARETWEQLAKEYPGTNAAAQARSLLGAAGAGTRPAR